MEVKIVDYYPKGNRRGLDFHYVREGGKLFHISNYATTVERGRREVTYVVDFSSIAGKWVYIFSRSNSGYPCFWRLKAEDLLKPSGRRELIDVSDEELSALELGDPSPYFRHYVRNNWDYMLRMREGVNGSRLREHAKYLTAHPGTSCFLESPVKGYWYCACWPRDGSRRRSISQIMKYLHQIWCLTIMVEGLGIGEMITKEFISIEQGRGWPSLVFRDVKGRVWSAWIEAQWVESLSVLGGWVRADIVFAEGDWRGKLPRCNVRGIKTEILVGCKHEEWSGWWDEKTKDQIRRYVETFKPKHALLVSLREVPEWLKREAESMGYLVFDGVRPGSEGVERLMNFLKTV